MTNLQDDIVFFGNDFMPIDAHADGTVAVAVVSADGPWTALPDASVTDREWVRCN